MTDLSPDERKLLPFATITVLRSRASLRRQTLLAWPFPDCHECGQTVEQVISQEKHFPAVSISFACKPCGHKTELHREAAHRISEAAVRAADQLESQGLMSAPDWLRGGVCCGCNGAGGPVVYRNHQDQAFCEHCAECDCRTIPCTKPAPAGLREQYAAAIVQGGACVDLAAATDAVLAVRDGQLEKLRKRLDEYRDSRRRWMDAANRDRQAALDADARARKAEAAIEAALTALHDLPYEYAKPILAALDRTEQT